MADVFASAGAGGRNCRLDWTLDFDDVANTVTLNATHTHFDGTAAPDPPQAQITIQLNTSVDITVDLLTGLMSQGGQFSQAAPGKIVNQGPKVRTGVRLKVSANRAGALSFSTQYTPPG
jgi:hypothetical protein